MTENTLGNIRTNTSTAHQRTCGSPQIMDHPTALMDIGASFEVGEVTTPGTGEDVAIGARLTADDIERGTGKIENTSVRLFPRLGGDSPRTVLEILVPDADYLVAPLGSQKTELEHVRV